MVKNERDIRGWGARKTVDYMYRLFQTPQCSLGARIRGNEDIGDDFCILWVFRFSLGALSLDSAISAVFEYQDV
jgi:hypothetical protein